MWQKEDDNIKKTWAAAITYCDSLSLGGYSDWRIPTIKGLQTIVNYGTYNPSIDTTYFPNTDFSSDDLSNYRSSTAYAPDMDFVWGGDFRLGHTQYHYKLDNRYVRCVRGEELPFGYFTDNDDGTVTDIGTGLMWQQEEGGEMKWAPALTYCEGLFLAGYDDWRLPNIKELASITDHTKRNPSIDETYFPGTGGWSKYWSSTVLDISPTSAWNVSTDVGFVGMMVMSSSYNVRCVR